MFLSLLDLLRQEAGGLIPLEAGAAPATTVTDLGDALLFRAALHGIDPKSVQVQVTETGLAIGGARTAEARTEGPDFFQYQSTVSRFYRELPLPCRIHPRGATLRWEGESTLLVTLPKA